VQLVAQRAPPPETDGVALEHALLVSLRERPATGIELTRRFDRSIGFFWRATHQQIYKVLRRMQDDGWVTASAGANRSTERRYAVTPLGDAALADWIASPTPPAALRSDLAVKLRGASYGDRARLLAHLADLVAEHRSRLAHFERLERDQFPDTATLEDHDLDTWLVLRGGIKQEQFWIEWLTEYVDTWTHRTEGTR
jgi:DNA-binding PadR family transcriptional regulator